jgi:prephenate dehydrogenase
MSGAKSGDPLFGTVAVVGVGLIGGSLGMAARKKGLAKRVIGLGRSEAKLMRAKILGAIDEYSLDIDRGGQEADLVIICTPVRTVVPTLERMAAHLKKGAIITDVGSTKREIVREASKVTPNGRSFVGGHPMAGSEQAGVERAKTDLFEGATYVITNTDDTDLAALGKLTAFAEALGARVEIMSPEEHDAATAVISHLPHAMSAALLHLAADSQRRSGKTFRLAAGSFRDLTRISDSPPEIWADICATNPDSIIESVRGLSEMLDAFAAALEAGDDAAVRRFFEAAREIREAYTRLTK